MKAFVTGATGFIGSYLVRWLVSEGHEIMCLKRPSSIISDLIRSDNTIKWVDINTNWQVYLIEFSPDIIYNLAWDGVSANDRIIWSKQLSNIYFQQDLLNGASMCGCKKYVGIGSQSEYGDFNQLIDESYPENPKTAYASCKLACLDILRTFCDLNDIAWYWYRLFPIFGPGESEKWLIPSLIKTIYTKHSMDLTLGEQRLPYLYVGECAKAIGMSIYTTGKAGIYNVCSDNPMSLRELVTIIKDKIKPEFQLNFGAIPYRHGQSMYMEGETKKLRENIYNLDTSSFSTRLDETIEYYKAIYSNGDNR